MNRFSTNMIAYDYKNTKNRSKNNDYKKITVAVLSRLQNTKYGCQTVDTSSWLPLPLFQDAVVPQKR